MSILTLSTHHRLDPDTQAVLLLYGRFGQPVPGAEPLTMNEYNSLVQWLRRNNLRPSDLFEDEWRHYEHLPVSPGRLQALLGRGVALALEVENWTNQGLWVMSRGDAAYPRRLKAYLGHLAPPILYGAGACKDRIPDGGLAVVGARAADDAALIYASGVAEACVAQRIPIISGGARGVDTTAMESALTGSGQVIGMLADSLLRFATSKRYRQSLVDGQLTLLSPFHPQAGFSAGNAMARNKYIYALAEWGLVVSSGMNEGGTWAGAVEALRARRIPVFVRLCDDFPEGNRRLAEMGALPFPDRPWTDLTARLQADTQAQKEAEGNTSTLPVLPQTKRTNPRPNQLSFVLGPAPESPPEPVDVPATAPDLTSETTSRESQLMMASSGGIFDAVWPILHVHLRESRTVQELARVLEVRPVQLQDWLNRGVQEGKISKKTRPVRYVAG